MASRLVYYAATVFFVISFLNNIAHGADVSSTQTGIRLINQAEKEELRALQLTIGRFSSGEVPVYKGDISVSDSTFGGNERTLPRSPVVAWIEEFDDLAGNDGFTLTMASSRDNRWIRLRQLNSETTFSTRLRLVNASSGVEAHCKNCIDDFSKQPNLLLFTRFLAQGKLGDTSRTKFVVRVVGSLFRVQPNSLRLDDIELMQPGFKPLLRAEANLFKRKGDVGILTVQGELRELMATPEGSPPQTRCERSANYSAERFVNLENLNKFGVRDLKITAIDRCCLDHNSHGKPELCVAEEVL